MEHFHSVTHVYPPLKFTIILNILPETAVNLKYHGRGYSQLRLPFKKYSYSLMSLLWQVYYSRQAMFTTRENLITSVLGSIFVHQIFRNCRGFNNLRVQTYDMSSLTTLIVKISVL